MFCPDALFFFFFTQITFSPPLSADIFPFHHLCVKQYVVHTTPHNCTVSSLNCRWSLCNSLTHTETHQQFSTYTLFNMWKRFSVRKDEKWKWDPWVFWQKMHPDNLYRIKHWLWDLMRVCVRVCVCVYLCMNVLYDVKGEGRNAKINLIKNLIAAHQSLSKNNSSVWYEDWNVNICKYL